MHRQVTVCTSQLRSRFTYNYACISCLIFVISVSVFHVVIRDLLIPQYCNFSRTHLTFGRGLLYFHMVNMRAVYRIAFFTGGIYMCIHMLDCI